MFLKTITSTGIVLFLALFAAPLLLGAPLQQKIDLNTADQKNLETLPGVGPTTAERIIEYREENGRFGRIEEIMNVWGIGEKKFEKLKDFITVNSPVTEKPEPNKANPKKEEPF